MKNSEIKKLNMELLTAKKMIENLKCCGNCGQSRISYGCPYMGNNPENCCENWTYDGMGVDDR